MAGSIQTCDAWDPANPMLMFNGESNFMEVSSKLHAPSCLVIFCQRKWALLQPMMAPTGRCLKWVR